MPAFQWRAAAAAAALCVFIGSPAFAAESAPQGPDDLTDLSIEQLAQIQVRSASKRNEPLSSAPTALFVITSDDIESSGVTSLPEALRLAPNLSVQQVDASQYSISARGFNGVQAGNKVLALIDGRSIYTPLGSTVFWNLHWPLLEDIQQIEVISGPGGTLYGPNAVNGVINVTTKDAQDTLGALVRGTAGDEERTAAARYGFQIGRTGAMRVYADWHDVDELPTAGTNVFDDAFRGWQAGFRSDFVSEGGKLTLQGDAFRDTSAVEKGDGAHGQNLLGRWTQSLSPSSSFQLQAYYDYFKRRFILVDDSLETFDVEGQLNTTVGRHEFVAGGGLRTTRDEFINELNAFNLVPPRRRLWVANSFVQDRYRLSPDLSLIAGVKLERSTFSGWQVLPNLRMAWQPDDRTLVWAAVSRAVRTPSRIDRQLQALPLLAPSPEFTSEKLVAVEAGYRGQPSSDTSISVNGFVNFYDDLRSTEFVDGRFQLTNGEAGRTYGIEAWGNAQLAPGWRASLGISTLWKDLHNKPGHLDLAVRNSLGNDPTWQLTARSNVDLTSRLHVTVDARAVGPIDQQPKIGSYVEAGGEIAFDAAKQIQLFVAGRNLLHKTHVESNDPTGAQLAERTVYAGARARF